MWILIALYKNGIYGFENKILEKMCGINKIMWGGKYHRIILK
jgi:hypothetical protein